MVGLLCGIAGNQAYRDPPLYRKGHASALGMTMVTFLAAVSCWFYLKWKNAQKQKNLEAVGEEDISERERLRDMSWDVVGDDHPDFFYTT
jgi:hypothetical protein